MKFRLFISSVQSEFGEARMRLACYIRRDALLGKFFEPFLFEETPACDRSASGVYLDEVRRCDLYLALLGKSFGHEVRPGVSATECEYDLATELGKPRLAFVQEIGRREESERIFVKKVEGSVVRKGFRTYDELQLAVYAALVRFLEQSGYVRVAPFDMAFDTGLTIADIDTEKVSEYLSRVRDAGKITIPENADAHWVLEKLDAVSSDGRLTNAAVLLFAKDLVRTHDSRPRNVTLAKALDWAGFVERSGHGTEFIVEQCEEIHLKTPEFRPRPSSFHAIIWRNARESHDGHMSGICQAYDGHMSVREKVIKSLVTAPSSRREIAAALGMSWNAGFLKLTLDTLLADEIIEFTIPSKLRSRFQKYRLTKKGYELADSAQTSK